MQEYALSLIVSVSFPICFSKIVQPKARANGARDFSAGGSCVENPIATAENSYLSWLILCKSADVRGVG